MVYASSTNDWRCQSWSAPKSDDWNVEWGSLDDAGANAPSWKEWGHKEPSWKSQATRTSLRSSAEPWSSKTSWSSWQKPQQPQQPVQNAQFYCVPFGYVLTGVPCSMNVAPALTPGYAPAIASAPQSTAQDGPDASWKAEESPKMRQESIEVKRPTTPEGEELAPPSAPLDPSELPSVGSAGHFDGSCKRCAFFPKGRCRNGKDCTHCHFEHLPRSRLRKRDPTRPRSQAKADHEESVESIPDEPTSDTESPLSDDPALSEPELADGFPSGPPTTAEEATPEEAVEVDTAATSSAAVSDDDMPARTSSEPSSSESPSREDPSGTVKASAARRGELSSSPKSWAAMQKLRKQSRSQSEIGEQATTADITRSSRALLNKLTEERFESLCTQLLALPLASAAHLEALALEIFEKATTQHSFRAMYTQLCLRFDAHLAERSDNPAIGGKAFRKALANACQATFERHLHSQDNNDKDDLPADEKLEAELKMKEQRLGNMRFIGELLKNRLLAPKLMLPIVHELQDSDEVALESLIALLTIIAPSFETEGSLYKAPLRDAFASLRKRQADKAVSSRLRCQLADLFEARARNWAPRSPASRQP